MKYLLKCMTIYGKFYLRKRSNVCVDRVYYKKGYNMNTFLEVTFRSIRRLLSVILLISMFSSLMTTSVFALSNVQTIAKNQKPKITSIIKTAAINDQLFLNPGFENGNSSSWYEWHPSGQNLSFGVDKYDIKSGNYKAYFWNTAAYRQSLHQYKSGLTNGTYEISVWIKLSVSGGTPKLARLEVAEYGGVPIFQTLIANNTWTQYQINIDVTSGNLDFGVYLDSPGRTSLQIDDASLKAKSYASLTPVPTSISTFTPSPSTTIIPTPTPSINANQVTIYYRQGFNNPYIHYHPVGGSWTAVPGIAMVPSEISGYYKTTINIGQSKQIEACFTDGLGVWDRNGGANYFFNTGTYNFQNGIITAGVPTPVVKVNNNGTMIQYYEWDMVADGKHWNRLKDDAQHLADIGITAVWLPPVSKGAGGPNDVGYGVFDHYDLGEFNQKGSVRTKYGTKDELKTSISSVHSYGMQAYVDIVMNQLIAGPGDEETINVVEVNPYNRNQDISSAYDIKAYTKLNYAARNGKYSTFTWNSSFFTGVDYNINNGKKAIYRLNGKSWSPNVDTNEFGNYDYLLGNDVDIRNSAVQDYFKTWGVWLTNELNLDGYRLDAAKHIDFGFMKDWVNTMRVSTGKNLFAVAEYASGYTPTLENYLNKVGWNQSVFDFKLKGNFNDANKAAGNFDMRNLRNDTFSMKYPTFAVTKVNSHDSQPGQVGGDSYIPAWFQPIAYAYILTRQEGYPFVFYGDYYGIPSKNIAPLKDKLDPILFSRKEFAYGKQNDYFDHWDIVGWTREGDADHPNSGLASIISDATGGSKWMYVGKNHAGQIWYDITGNRPDVITINVDGWGEFKVNNGSASIYVNRQK